jgi:aerobic C4-dicarboxylate transport protein
MSNLKRFLSTLYVQVVIAIVLGILTGHFFPEVGVGAKPLGDLFIKLIQMIIAPIVFVTVALGIHGAGDLKRVGKTGLKTLVYFEVVSTLALCIGLISVNVFRPGAGMNVDASTLSDAADFAKQSAPPTATPGVPGFVADLIPASAVDAFARGNILQVLVVAIFFGFAMVGLEGKGQKLCAVLHLLSDVLFKVVGFIMRLAPLGAFGAIAFTTGKYGNASLWSLGKLMGTFYLTCLVFVICVLGAVTLWCRVNLWRIIKHFKEELLITLGTASTEAVMPRLLAKLERLGCSKSVTGLVIPTGYSFNLDGAAIYFTMAGVFIAQATNTPLPLSAQLGLLAVLLVTSKGGAGVAGSAFVVLSATLASTHTIPVEGMALILGVDRFMNEARAVTNLIGNIVATIAVARWQGEFDVDAYRKELIQDEA